MTPTPGTSLPERLRSKANLEPEDPWLLIEAADELDRRAERIQRLTTGITAMRLRGEMALRDEEQPPLDPETPGYIPDRDSDEEGSGEVGAGSDEPYGEYDPPGLLVAVHPDGLVTVARDV